MKRLNSMLHWANFNRKYEPKFAKKMYQIFLDMQQNAAPQKSAAGDILVAIETRYKRNLETFYNELIELSNGAVEEFIKQHIIDVSPDSYRLSVNFMLQKRGAWLLTNLTEVEKEKLTYLMQLIGHEVSYNEFAAKLRPYIGLTRPQVERLFKIEQQLREEGLPDVKIQKVLDKTSKQMLRYRSLMIARTEMAYTYSHAQTLHMSYYQQKSGKQVEKVWNVSPDDLTCETCVNLDGERVNVNEAFSTGVAAPPAHPNCRCYLTFEVED